MLLHEVDKTKHFGLDQLGEVGEPLSNFVSRIDALELALEVAQTCSAVSLGKVRQERAEVRASSSFQRNHAHAQPDCPKEILRRARTHLQDHLFEPLVAPVLELARNNGV